MELHIYRFHLFMGLMVICSPFETILNEMYVCQCFIASPITGYYVLADLAFRGTLCNQKKYTLLKLIIHCSFIQTNAALMGQCEPHM